MPSTPTPAEQPCPHLRQTYPGTRANECLDCGMRLPPSPSQSARDAARAIADEFYFLDEHVRSNLKGREHEVYDEIAAIISKHCGNEVDLTLAELRGITAAPRDVHIWEVCDRFDVEIKIDGVLRGKAYNRENAITEAMAQVREWKKNHNEPTGL